MSAATAWALVALAIALEVLATSLLKLSDAFEKWHWGVLSMLLYGACFWLLAPALRALPVGVVYAVWAGVGILAVALIGVFAFGERLALVQYGCIVLIVIGAVGLQLTTGLKVPGSGP